MSDVTSLRISTWEGKFVVVGEFDQHSVIPRREFDTKLEAMKELSKIIQREVLRYELNNDRGFDR